MDLQKLSKICDSANKTEFTEEERKKLAKEGLALPDGSFPIRNKQDLKDAIHAIGLARSYSKTKKWIIKRAKELDAVDLLPEKWKVKDSVSENRESFERLWNAAKEEYKIINDPKQIKEWESLMDFIYDFSKFDDVKMSGKYIEVSGKDKKYSIAIDKVDMDTLDNIVDNNYSVSARISDSSKSLKEVIENAFDFGANIKLPIEGSDIRLLVKETRDGYEVSLKGDINVDVIEGDGPLANISESDKRKYVNRILEEVEKEKQRIMKTSQFRHGN